MSAHNSVNVHQSKDMPLIRMTCETSVEAQDLKAAYQDVVEVVSHSDESLYFMLDLSKEPNISMREIVSGALAGSYTNPKVRKWLVIGQSEASRSIANSLFFVTGEHKVVWFEDEAAAYEYLEALGWTIQH